MIATPGDVDIVSSSLGVTPALRLKAYLLAGDPEWIVASVASYYDWVEEIVVSYDSNGIGWTGAPILVSESLRLLRGLDTQHKLRYVGGEFYDPALMPMENDTRQRQHALKAVGADCDWILQVDSDEVLPNLEALSRTLAAAQSQGIHAVEWPMRVFFGATRQGTLLEVCAADGTCRFEYPGPLAVAPGVELVEARRVSGPFLRALVRGDNSSLQVQAPADVGEIRMEFLEPEDAVLHYSWAGSATRIRRKSSSWSHSNGWRTKAFYYLRWRPVAVLWRVTKDFHPFAKGLWPSLRPYHDPRRPGRPND